MKKLIFSLAIMAMILPLSALAEYTPDPGFDPSYIISDNEILDYTAMNLEQIKSFLKKKGGVLANYSCDNPDGETMTAAEVIYDRAITNKINPKFLIVLLQKEQGLVENPTPKSTQLDWATGYGCPDGGGCNDRWKGFWKQVNSASLQFVDYIENPHLYNFKKGETYTFTNPYSTIINENTVVTPRNHATAALYNYTPHVYNGNYNFWKLWRRYFSKVYPDGTLLQGKGEPGVWLIQHGEKRPFLTRGALTSRFDVSRIIQVDPSDLDVYPKGAPIKFPQYSIIRSPGGTLYLLVDDHKRGFMSGEAFRQIGYNPEEVMNASWEDVNSYEEGRPITVDDAYPMGALLQNNQTGGVYWVEGGAKAPLTDRVYLDSRFKGKKIIQTTPAELNKYETIDEVKFEDGTLVKMDKGRSVYIVAGGELRPFTSAHEFEGLGYKWENIVTIPQQVFMKYSIGEPIKSF